MGHRGFGFVPLLSVILVKRKFRWGPMARIVIAIFLLTNITPRLAAQGPASIEWGQPITFRDFESRPMETDTAVANISVTILLGYSSASDGNLTFRVVAVMDKDKSWIKAKFRNNHAILKHEQGHFDIAHIYAKKLEAGVKGKRYTKHDVQALHKIYDDYLEQMNAVQVRYDKETKGGMDPIAQSKWRRFIQAQLGMVD
jgi:hypothetical protein